MDFHFWMNCCFKQFEGDYEIGQRNTKEYKCFKIQRIFKDEKMNAGDNLCVCL